MAYEGLEKECEEILNDAQKYRNSAEAYQGNIILSTWQTIIIIVSILMVERRARIASVNVYHTM
jgi:hypothetical protein